MDPASKRIQSKTAIGRGCRAVRWQMVYILLNLALIIAPRGSSRDLLISSLRGMRTEMLAAIAAHNYRHTDHSGS